MLTVVAWIGVMALTTFDFMGRGVFEGSSADDWIHSHSHSHSVAWAVGLGGVGMVVLALVVAKRITAPVREAAAQGQPQAGALRVTGRLVTCLLIVNAAFVPAAFAIPLPVQRIEQVPLLRSPRWLLDNAAGIGVAVAIVAMMSLSAHAAGRLQNMADERARGGALPHGLAAMSRR